MNKYILRADLTKDIQDRFGNTVKLFRIQRTSDGEIGGWVESENNLDQEGNCWIADEAMAFGKSHVCENAQLFNEAIVCDNAMIMGNAKLRDRAEALGNAIVRNHAEIWDEACVDYMANIDGNVIVCDKAIVHKNPRLLYNAIICDNVFLNFSHENYRNGILLPKIITQETLRNAEKMSRSDYNSYSNPYTSYNYYEILARRRMEIDLSIKLDEIEERIKSRKQALYQAPEANPANQLFQEHVNTIMEDSIRNGKNIESRITSASNKLQIIFDEFLRDVAPENDSTSVKLDLISRKFRQLDELNASDNRITFNVVADNLLDKISQLDNGEKEFIIRAFNAQPRLASILDEYSNGKLLGTNIKNIANNQQRVSSERAVSKHNVCCTIM